MDDSGPFSDFLLFTDFFAIDERTNSNVQVALCSSFFSPPQLNPCSLARDVYSFSSFLNELCEMPGDYGAWGCGERWVSLGPLQVALRTFRIKHQSQLLTSEQSIVLEKSNFGPFLMKTPFLIE